VSFFSHLCGANRRFFICCCASFPSISNTFPPLAFFLFFRPENKTYVPKKRRDLSFPSFFLPFVFGLNVPSVSFPALVVLSFFSFSRVYGRER